MEPLNDKYRCNYCKSPNILAEDEYQGHGDYLTLYTCGDCGHFLDRMRLETMLLEEQIQTIPGFICTLCGDTQIILHASQPNDCYPKEWGGYSILFVHNTNYQDNHNG